MGQYTKWALQGTWPETLTRTLSTQQDLLLMPRGFSSHVSANQIRKTTKIEPVLHSMTIPYVLLFCFVFVFCL